MSDKNKPKRDPETIAADHETEMAERRGFRMPDSIPSFNWGAFFMPPIWGAAHGQWMTLLFYPLWVFADSVFRDAFYGRSPVFIAAAAVMFVLMAAATVFYAATAQKPAYYRVRGRYTPEQYVRRERIWAFCMVAVGVVFIALATYYNLVLLDPTTLGLW